MQVNVNPAFVRANEIARLCGDPRKLNELIGAVATPSLRSTLEHMLSQAVTVS